VKKFLQIILILSLGAVLYGYFGHDEGAEVLGVFVGVVTLLVFAEWAAKQKQ
jgi:hypothetical protein